MRNKKKDKRRRRRSTRRKEEEEKEGTQEEEAEEEEAQKEEGKGYLVGSRRRWTTHPCVMKYTRRICVSGSGLRGAG